MELGLVRTKLKQTEIDLKQVKDSNDILAARNKLFEGKRLNDAYEKLFNDEPTPVIASSSQTPRPPPPTPTTCLTPPPPPPPQSSPLDTLIQLEILKNIQGSSGNQTKPSLQTNDSTLHSKFDSLLLEFRDMKNKLDTLDHKVSSSKPTQDCDSCSLNKMSSFSSSSSQTSGTTFMSASTQTSDSMTDSSQSIFIPPHFNSTVPPPNIEAPPDPPRPVPPPNIEVPKYSQPDPQPAHSPPTRSVVLFSQHHQAHQ